jgi:sulfate adenylyltransferase
VSPAGAGTGFTIWLTGLSGSGKTTVGHLVADELERRGLVVDVLDGDVVRTHLSQGLGFSKDDRDTNIARIGWVASRVSRAGAAVVVAAISPYAEARNRARKLVEEHSTFVEVHVATGIDECERRDPKGLYAKARSGELADFTGVSAPYEEPVSPELRLHTEGETPEVSAGHVIDCLVVLGLVSPDGRA